MSRRTEDHYVKHTYQFYKDRRNNPKWRPYYLKYRQRRILIASLIGMFTLLLGSIIVVGSLYSNAGKHVPADEFHKSTEKSSTSTAQSSSSSTEPSSSSSEKKLTMDNLDLNHKIAVLAQAYFYVNTNTTILQADKLAMSNSWDNGPIEWYDAQGARHKLDVRVDGDTITYSYVDPVSGQPTTKTTSVNDSMERYLLATNAIKATESIAAKVVAPAELKPLTYTSSAPNDGGRIPNNYNDISSMKDNSASFFEKKDLLSITNKQLLDPIYKAAHGDIYQFFGKYVDPTTGNQIVIMNDTRSKNYNPSVAFYNPHGTGAGSDNKLVDPIAAGRSQKGHLDSQTDFIEYPFKDMYGKEGIICLTASKTPQSSQISLGLITFSNGQRIYYEPK